MRAVAVVLIGSLVASGCATSTYQIPAGELARLAHTPPELRGQHVRVVQEVLETDLPTAPEARIFFLPYVEIDGSIHTRRGQSWYGSSGFAGGGGHVHSGHVHGGGGRGGGSVFGGGGSGGDGRAEAAIFLVIAATVLITATAVEASRFDGFAELPPMYPVHLIGHDGAYDVVPLAYLDDDAVAWARTAIVADTDGPWRRLEHAPLDRAGLTYAMYGGLGSMRSAAGDLALGTAWTVQLGGFVTQRFGLLASVFFGWRDNRFGATMFDSRYTAEAQYFPVQAGRLHAGLFAGGGVAQRFEDAVPVRVGSDTSLALDGGAMLQLDINTRLAITARFGVTYAHEEQSHTALLGLSVY